MQSDEHDRWRFIRTIAVISHAYSDRLAETGWVRASVVMQCGEDGRHIEGYS